MPERSGRCWHSKVDQAERGSGASSVVAVLAATPDGRFLYQECGGTGQLLAYRIGHDGGLTLIQTVTGLPIPFEGIALN